MSALEDAIAAEFMGRPYSSRAALAREVADFILRWCQRNLPLEEVMSCEFAGNIDGHWAAASAGKIQALGETDAEYAARMMAVLEGGE